MELYVIILLEGRDFEDSMYSTFSTEPSNYSKVTGNVCSINCASIRVKSRFTAIRHHTLPLPVEHPTIDSILLMMNPAGIPCEEKPTNSPLEAHEQGTGSPWTACGQSTDRPWTVYRQPIDSRWAVHGQPMDIRRVAHGRSTENPCTVYMQSMDS